jgi:polysaccharide deacetylase family protein (PEP-CTERM system associated)
MKNYLTIDVEEYYHVSAFEDIIRPKDWDQYESRVDIGTNAILDLFAEHDLQATFFIVGKVAEKNPDLIRRIHSAGHEIGCHSYLHRKVYDLTPEQFREDTLKAKTILENSIGAPVVGYRAPSYSITRQSLWALPILVELGFRYDSSIFPTLHDTYGIPDAPRFEYRLQEGDMVEYPISTVRLLGRNIPVAGGGYFRLFPYWFTKWALRRINRVEQMPFMFYLHPWELDQDQPRMNNAKLLSRFRHYNNLDKTGSRLRYLLQDFSFTPISQ